MMMYGAADSGFEANLTNAWQRLWRGVEQNTGSSPRSQDPARWKSATFAIDNLPIHFAWSPAWSLASYVSFVWATLIWCLSIVGRCSAAAQMTLVDDRWIWEFMPSDSDAGCCTPRELSAYLGTTVLCSGGGGYPTVPLCRFSCRPLITVSLL